MNHRQTQTEVLSRITVTHKHDFFTLGTYRLQFAERSGYIYTELVIVSASIDNFKTSDEAEYTDRSTSIARLK